MKTKSNMTVKPKTNNSGLIDNQPTNTGLKPKELDWEKEFEIKYGRNSGRLTFYNEQKYYWNYKFYDEVKQFLSDQIQKAYYLGIQLGYAKHLKTELLKSIKRLSIQSKEK